MLRYVKSPNRNVDVLDECLYASWVFIQTLTKIQAEPPKHSRWHRTGAPGYQQSVAVGSVSPAKNPQLRSPPSALQSATFTRPILKTSRRRTKIHHDYVVSINFYLSDFFNHLKRHKWFLLGLITVLVFLSIHRPAQTKSKPMLGKCLQFLMSLWDSQSWWEKLICTSMCLFISWHNSRLNQFLSFQPPNKKYDKSSI